MDELNSLNITGLIFGCTFGGAVLGMLLHRGLPDSHLSADTRDTVKLAAGIVGTMTAVLLGLLVASAKSSFDVQRNGVAQLAANAIMLDRALAHFGDETRGIRETLRDSVNDIIDRTWPAENPQTRHNPATPDTEGRHEALFDSIMALAPKSEPQRALQSLALKTITDTGQSRWLLFSQRDSSIPAPLLGLMVFWLTISFASFGLFAPRNTTSVVALMASALAVASALFLVLELDRPFRGMIQISSTPLHKALEQLGR